MHDFQSSSPQPQPRRFEDFPDFALRPRRRGSPAGGWLLLGVGLVMFLGLVFLWAGFVAYQRVDVVGGEMSNPADLAMSYRTERDSPAMGLAETPAAKGVTLDGAFVKLMKSAEKASLYEGLPHQQHEPALLKKERETKKTLLFGDFYFYEEPFELKDTDSDAVRAIISDPDTFQPYSGGCGSYHPDYLVEWYAEGETVRVYLCFGCGEAKVVGPNGETKYSLSGAAQTNLKNVLLAYHKNRPDSEGWLKMAKDYRPRQ